MLMCGPVVGMVGMAADPVNPLSVILTVAGLMLKIK
jgi:hypothetical protein